MVSNESQPLMQFDEGDYKLLLEYNEEQSFTNVNTDGPIQGGEP